LGTISKTKEKVRNLLQRDVVLIRVPFSNRKRSKPRPVIVISNDNYNKTSEDFIAIPMTSQLVSWSHIVRITNEEMEDGELKKNSVARVDKITSLYQGLVIHHIGQIKNQTYSELKRVLLEVI
jgi:mRNA-degrading endonuclease toxin of MazEF toxin-antitoxin module